MHKIRMRNADPAPYLGRRAVFITYEGVRMIGTLAEGDALTGWYPRIVFDDGRWGRADGVLVLAD